MKYSVVLYQPQIPQNTGTIARTSAAVGADLILVRPLGFSTNSRHLKRAGLDYWGGVHVEEIDDIITYLEGRTCFFFSSKAEKRYSDTCYPPDATLVFGSETSGLPSKLRELYSDRFFTIPMISGNRCLNLACSVSIVLYEALRQNHFLFPKNNEKKNDINKLTNSEVVNGR